MSAVEEARACLEAGDHRRALELAKAALAASPGDAALLRIAGRAGVELAAPDATEDLRAVTKLQPDDAEAWHDLGDALLAEGRTEEANEAFRRVLDINPDDPAALSQLGHGTYAAGADEGVAFLERAAERTRGRSSAVISLVEMYRQMGQPEEALAAATRICEADPGDLQALLDVAELSLETGRLDEALAAFQTLREREEQQDHLVLVLHGMAEVELVRGDTARALAYARDAEAGATHARTGAIVTHLEGGDAPDVPTRADVDAMLAASRAEHRRLHDEDRRLQGVTDLG